MNETTILSFNWGYSTGTTILSYSNGWTGINGGLSRYALSPDLTRQKYLPPNFGVAPGCFDYYTWSTSWQVFDCADGQILGTNTFGYLSGFNVQNELIWYSRTVPAASTKGLLARRSAAVLVSDATNTYNLGTVML
jgi:hypothetical protein